MREFGMEDCKGKETPVTKEGADKAGEGAQLVGEQASKVRRGIAIINYMA